MKQFLITSLKQIKCVISGHDVSEEDESELFKSRSFYLKTKCINCNYPLLLRRDPADKEGTYMLMERED